MSRHRSLVRAVAGALIVGVAFVGYSDSGPVRTPPATGVAVLGPSSTHGSTVGSPGTGVAHHGVVTGPVGTCTCAGGGMYRPGSENESKPPSP